MSARRSRFVPVAKRSWIAAASAAVVGIGLLVLAPTASAGQSDVITPGREPYPAGGTTVTGIGQNLSGENAQLAETFPAAFRSGWAAQPALVPGSANDRAVSIGVSDGRTVVVDRQAGAAYVSAYVSTSGALLWRRPVIFPGPAVVVDSMVYLNSEDEQRVDITQALDLATGTVRWTSRGGVSNDDALSVGSGLLVSGDKAMDLLTGETKFFLAMAATAGNSLVGADRIFYNSEREIQAHSVTTGAVLWSFTKTDSSGDPLVGALQPILHDGLLYLPADAQNPGSRSFVLDPGTGKLITTLPASPGGMAFDNSTAIIDAVEDPDDPNSVNVLTAVDVSTGHVYWSRAFGRDADGFRFGVSTPVIENGLVWTTTDQDDGHPMTLVALSEVSGEIVSSTTLACPAAGSDLAFAEHRLAVPSLCGVLTFDYDQGATGSTSAVPPSPSASTPSSPSPSTPPAPPPAATRAHRPQVSLQPHSRRAHAGALVRFVAKATGAPAPNVRWQVRRHGHWTTLRGATRQSVSVRAAAHRNGDRLRARFSNSAGVVYTRVVRLVVTRGAR